MDSCNFSINTHSHAPSSDKATVIPELNLLLLNDPPIFEVEPGQIQAQGDALIKDIIDNWGKVEPAANPPTKDDINPHNKLGRTYQEIWNTRYDYTLAQFSLKNKFNPMLFKGGTVYEYQVDGRSIGLMNLVASYNHLEVDGLITHPGSIQAGGIMIEFAVNKSAQEGYGGRIRLMAVVEDAQIAYESMGFTYINTVCSKKMKLKPATSADWINIDGQWKLVKYKDTSKYYG